jgi:hypothetical protein
MEDVISWIVILLGAGSLAVGFLTYRDQRGRKRLEYLVVSNIRVVPRSVSTKLGVVYDGSPVPDASILIVRLVNTGDKAVRAEDFNSDLAIRIEGAHQVVSALATRSRPTDLGPEVSVGEDRVLVAPLLLNPGDMIELQLLVSGIASIATVEGRLADVSIVARKELPYPPGTGPEGELDNAFEKFMWYGLPPVIAFMIAGQIVVSDSVGVIARGSALAIALLFTFVFNPMFAGYLIRRRRRWAPYP